MSSPRVSIITPSYNQAQYLEQCIVSVLEQDYPNIEYIIMDGGSSDGSVEIIKKYAHRLAYWVSQPDGGQSAAINAGLRRSTGEIWAWMNADDAYLPGAVSKAAAWLFEHPEHDIIYGDCIEIDANGANLHYRQSKKIEPSKMMTDGIHIPSGSTFIRRRVREHIGNLNESLHYVMDIEYWLRAFLKVSFGYVPETLSQYRIHAKAKTFDSDQSRVRGEEMLNTYLAFWNRADIPPHLKPIRTRSLAGICLFAADLACSVGDRPLCLQYIQKAFNLDGITAIQPRLIRLLIHMFFSERAVRYIRNFWKTAA